MLCVKIASLKEELRRRGLGDKVNQATENWGDDKEFLLGLLEQILIQDNKERFRKMKIMFDK